MSDIKDNNLEQASITELIERVFDRTNYPGDKKIVVPPVTDYEVRETLDLFRGRTWRQLVSENMTEDARSTCSDHMVFLTSTAFAFYLPAFMIFTIGSVGVGPISFTALTWCLTPDSSLEWKEPVFDSLNIEQRNCVVTYIKHMSAIHGSWWRAPGAVEFWSRER